MRFIIHAGLHKTGTSSLQSALVANRHWLKRHKISYPLGSQSGRNVNFLAAHLAAGRREQAQSFFQGAVARAQRSGATTVLMSAESLYAMSAFLGRLIGRPVDDYWRSERGSVNLLKSLLPGDSNVMIVFYLRRQDEFISSIYNQFVKQANGFSGSVEDFIGAAGPVADYCGHLQVWREVFGSEAVAVRIYEEARNDLVGDFLRSIGFGDTSGFLFKSTWINESLDADWLRFKRVVNRLPMSRAESYVVSRVISRLSREQCGCGLRANFLEPKLRDAVLRQCCEGNKEIARSVGRPGEALFLPPVSGERLDPWDVPLDPALGMECMLRFVTEMGRPEIQAELLVRRAYQGLVRRYPMLENLMSGVRSVTNAWRVRRERRTGEALSQAQGSKKAVRDAHQATAIPD